MKKFILYSSGLTLLTLVFGLLTVYGFFDVSSGKTQLIGNVAATKTEVDIHNNIVDTIHNIGLQAKKSLETTQALTPETSMIDDLKAKVDKIRKTRESLEQYMERNTFKRNKQTIQQLFKTTYLPTLIQYEYSYRKFFSYASSKAINQKSLDAFSQTISDRFLEYQQAHNIMVEELNRVRRY